MMVQKEERETEETIKSFKQLSAAQLAQIAAAQVGNERIITSEHTFKGNLREFIFFKAQYATDGAPFTSPSQKQSVAGRIRK